MTSLTWNHRPKKNASDVSMTKIFFSSVVSMLNAYLSLLIPSLFVYKDNHFVLGPILWKPACAASDKPWFTKQQHYRVNNCAHVFRKKIQLIILKCIWQIFLYLPDRFLMASWYECFRFWFSFPTLMLDLQKLLASTPEWIAVPAVL